MTNFDSSNTYHSVGGTSHNSIIFNWFKHVKIYKIIISFLVLLIIMSLFIHYYLLNVSLMNE